MQRKVRPPKPSAPRVPICQLRPVTAALVVAQVALYVREHLSPRQHPYSSKCGLIPERVRKGEGYRLLTSNFVHKSELHLLVRHCIVQLCLDPVVCRGRCHTHLLSSVGRGHGV